MKERNINVVLLRKKEILTSFCERDQTSLYDQPKVKPSNVASSLRTNQNKL